MHKINNKSHSQQVPQIAHLLNLPHQSCSSHNTRSSLSLSSAHHKLQLYNSMCKSLKPNAIDFVVNGEDQGHHRDRFGKIHTCNNFSMTKSKSNKVSESYYYKLEKKTRDQEPNKNLATLKDTMQGKIMSNRRVPDYKPTKPKLPTRKTSKNRNDNKIVSSSNHQSLKQLISSTQFSQNLTKLQTVRTFSPEIQLGTETRKKDKKLGKREEELLARMGGILSEYRNTLNREQKEKEILLRQNRKLRQKISIINSQKKYKNVLQYKM